jgi:hypothetical protein
MTTTLFTWGYYGWGNHTPDLVKAVDAVETNRGFQPPMFVGPEKGVRYRCLIWSSPQEA